MEPENEKNKFIKAFLALTLVMFVATIFQTLRTDGKPRNSLENRVEINETVNSFGHDYTEEKPFQIPKVELSEEKQTIIEGRSGNIKSYSSSYSPISTELLLAIAPKLFQSHSEIVSYDHFKSYVGTMMQKALDLPANEVMSNLNERDKSKLKSIEKYLSSSGTIGEAIGISSIPERELEEYTSKIWNDGGKKAWEYFIGEGNIRETLWDNSYLMTREVYEEQGNLSDGNEFAYLYKRLNEEIPNNPLTVALRRYSNDIGTIINEKNEAERLYHSGELSDEDYETYQLRLAEIWYGIVGEPRDYGSFANEVFSRDQSTNSNLFYLGNRFDN